MMAARLVFFTITVSSSFGFVPHPHRGDACRFFLDTADVDNAWRELLPMGIFHGITTNPTILERASQPCTICNLHALAATAFDLGANEFMCQAWGTNVEDVVERGIALAATDLKRIVVKVPVTQIGLEAASIMMKDYGIRICLTAGYNSQQALLAVGVGAEYLAPYLGRMTDAGKDGVDECLAMLDVVEGLQGTTRILVASIRDSQTLSELAGSGMDTFTFSPDVARQLLNCDELTVLAADEFEQSALRNS